MYQQEEFMYYVIEFLEPKDLKFDKYICIPNSWIRLRETIDGVAIVKFPVDEDLSETKKRVKNGENYSDNWAVLLADVKYGTNSYEDATNYILDKMAVEEQHNIKIVEKGVPSVSDKIFKSLSETNKVSKSSALLSRCSTCHCTEPTNNQTMSEQLQLTNSEVVADKQKTKVIGTMDSTIKPIGCFTRESLRMSSNNCVEESGKPKYNQENESSLVNNLPKLNNKSELFAKLQPFFGGNFKETLKNLHSDCKRNEMMFEKMRLAYHQQCTVLEEIIELTDQFNVIDCSNSNSTVRDAGNASVVGEKNVNEEVNKVTGLERQKTTHGNKEKIDNNDGCKNITDGDKKDEDKNKPPDKIRAEGRKFTFPPEYEENNSKWTLKHRKKKKGLVELVPFSGVYVDAVKLGHCKRMSKASRTLARLLLVEVFSESALRTCSLTGKKTFHADEISIRPGLDEHALTVLLNYVEQHAHDQKWVKTDPNAIMTSLRNKMQDIRSKHEWKNYK